MPYKEEAAMFNEFPDQKIVDHSRKIYPSGTRCAGKMEDPYTQLKPGDGGKVLCG